MLDDDATLNINDELKSSSSSLKLYYFNSESHYTTAMTIEIKYEKERNVLILCIMIICLIILVIFMIYGLIMLVHYWLRENIAILPQVQEELYVSSEDDRYNKVISQYPEVKYTEALSRFGQIMCTICLFNFIENESVKKLPCQHIYHANCFEGWVKATINKTLRCPMCNAGLLDDKQQLLTNREGLTTMRDINQTDLNSGLANVTSGISLQ